MLGLSYRLLRVLNVHPSPVAHSLEAFLALAEAGQLAYVEACATPERRADLIHLNDAYVRWAEQHQHDPAERRWVSLRVLARWLDILLPGDVTTDGYREAAQDGRLRQRLTGAALARLRMESYSGALGPLLAADDATRSRFIASLVP